MGEVLLVPAASVLAALAVAVGASTARARGTWWLAAAGVAAAVGAAAAVLRSPAPLAAALAASGLAAAATVDTAEGRIPTWVAHGTTAGSLVLLTASREWDALAWAVGLTGLLVGVVGGLWALGRAGFGDVRLAAATLTAMATGPVGLLVMVWGTLTAAGLVAVARRRVSRPSNTLPFAPSLYAGWLLAVVAVG